MECNVCGRDIGSFVNEAKNKIQDVEKSLPSGYFIEWGGKFENQRRAMRTLSLVVPIVFYVNFCFWFIETFTFSDTESSLLFGWGNTYSVNFQDYFKCICCSWFYSPFWDCSGKWGGSGLIFFIQLRKEGLTIRDAIIPGCQLGLGPLLITSLTTILGIIPLVLSTRRGEEIQRFLAGVILAGLVSCWCLTLLVLPALYGWFEKDFWA